MECSSLMFDSPICIGDDENELFEPLPNEIKENQWLGVTVSSQKSNSTNHGVVRTFFYLLLIEINQY